MRAAVLSRRFGEDALPLAGLALLNLLLVLFFFRSTLTSIPGTGDENSILFQARIFSRLSLSAPAPPSPEPFLTDYIAVKDGRWFSIYPPFYAAILALGLRLGDVTALIAALSSATLVFVFLTVRRAYDDRALAWLTTALLFVAPSFRFYSASYYTHVGSCLAVAASLWLYLRVEEIHSSKAALLFLALTAAVGLSIRPFEVFWALLPLGAALLASGRLTRSRRVRVAVGIGVVCLLLFLLLGGKVAAGFPYETYLNTVNSGGRLSLSRCLNAAGAQRLWEMLADSAKWLFAYGGFAAGNLKDASVHDWDFSPYLLTAGLLFAGVEAAREPRLRGRHLLFLTVVASVVLGHLFYDKKGGRFGERRFLEAGFIFCLFAARLLLAAVRRGPRSLRVPVLAALFVPNLAVYLPGTMLWVHDNMERRMGVFLAAERLGLRDSLVLFAGYPEFYPRFYSRNDPYLEGNVFLPYSDAGRQAARLLPGRPSYLYAVDKSKTRYELRRLDRL